MGMTVAWRPNPTAPLWYEERRGEPVGPFFHDLSLQHTKQVGSVMRGHDAVDGGQCNGGDHHT